MPSADCCSTFAEDADSTSNIEEQGHSDPKIAEDAHSACEPFRHLCFKVMRRKASPSANAFTRCLEREHRPTSYVRPRVHHRAYRRGPVTEDSEEEINGVSKHRGGISRIPTEQQGAGSNTELQQALSGETQEVIFLSELSSIGGDRLSSTLWPKHLIVVTDDSLTSHV